jgi:hypothetical protein
MPEMPVSHRELLIDEYSPLAAVRDPDRRERHSHVGISFTFRLSVQDLNVGLEATSRRQEIPRTSLVVNSRLWTLSRPLPLRTTIKREEERTMIEL